MKINLLYSSTLILLLSACSAEQTANNWQTTSVDRGGLEMVISASGTLKATNTVEIGTQVSGVIEEVLVDFNDDVKAGQVIARLDDRMLRASLQQAHASVQQAELQLAQRERAYADAQRFNSGEQTDLSVREAEANRQQIKTQLGLAQRNFERYKNLYEKGAASRLEFESKQMEYERLQANYNAASTSVDRTKANLSTVDLQRTREDLLTAKANLQSARAAYRQAAVNLEHTEIRSPIDGVVLSRNIENGQTVAASFQTPILFSIANDLTKMEIEASIDESDIGYIQKGQAVSFTVDAYGQASFTGEVKEIRLQPAVVSNVVIYTVIIATQNADQQLMPGMTANLDIVTEQIKDALIIPVTALHFQPPTASQRAVPASMPETNSKDRSVIWQLVGDQLAPVQVEILLNNGRFAAVASDELSKGSIIVTGYEPQKTRGKADKEAQSPFMPSLPSRNNKQAS